MSKKPEEESLALYRKYRPKDWSEIRGQDHVVKALEGALKKGIIPHALLFAGSRGTGKTSAARIFASAIGTSAIDIYEIDAASNRGIDDIRELRDAVHTLPYESERKVYIIDEVHMLTKEAFNALLKTLEEPPKHVVFILATTEVDKLLETITSRCQVFTFRAPTRTILRDTVIDVAKKEKFTLPTAAADLIAIAADGSFRDALGITQKVIMASADTKADPDEVAEIIGAPKSALVMTIVSALNERNAEMGLHALKEAGEQNTDMGILARLLLERIRTVLLLRHSPKDGEEMLAQLPEEDVKVITEISKNAKSPLNSQSLLRLLEATEQIGKGGLPTLPLELAVIEICGEEK